MYQNMENYRFWCQKVIPLVYDNSLSYYEVLCKVVKYINDLIGNDKAIYELLGEHGKDIDVLKKQVDYLSSELEKVKNGDYVSLYIDSLSKWIDENLNELVGRIAKFVTFGLDDEGYFVAYIPESWEQVEFDTSDKGELILRL